jgi:hypothetical protein
MKRVIIVPASEINKFPSMTVIARGGSIAALMGDSFEERSRKSFGSEEDFDDAIRLDRADRHTFRTEEEAASFAIAKIDALNAAARRVEEDFNRMAPPRTRKPPQFDERIPPPKELSA